MGKLIIHQPLGMDSIVVDLKWYPEKIEWENETIYNRGLTLQDIDDAYRVFHYNSLRPTITKEETK